MTFETQKEILEIVRELESTVEKQFFYNRFVKVTVEKLQELDKQIDLQAKINDNNIKIINTQNLFIDNLASKVKMLEIMF